MPPRRGRPGLVGTVARTAVVAGTASTVSNKVNDRHAAKAQASYQDQQAAYQSQADVAALQAQVAAQQKELEAQRSAAPAQPAGEDMMAQLQKLADLKAAGALTDEEFAAAKAKVLGT